MPTRKPAAPKPAPAALDKDRDLATDRSDPTDARLTTDQGVRIEHTDDSLRPGARGPSLMEDFHLREKITRFDHERIPERVVHARGSAAHGTFEAYGGVDDVTRAAFLGVGAKTPVFVRFSTVVGSRGSSDLARDVRGFAVKFYTSEGNFDLVGNNIPVFFIQDGIKFPDLVHAVKPEPHHEMPQAASAHDTFWDFVGLVPESLHMVMWVMSDRGLPRSYRMMEGFGVHTFRMVNAAGESSFVKFHWKPVLGVASVVWEEAQMISGKDPDFHRRDLWEAIEAGAFPQWELGIQVVTEAQAAAIGVDLLDPTKLIPEEVVPVRRIGKLTLDRNPTNFFAETEQVAFCVSNVVPGIDVTNDALMQARLFSYLDTQLTRLGGPNHAEIPINRPVCPVHNHQQDGLHRQTSTIGRVNYHPNSLGGGCPVLSTRAEGGYVHFPEPVEGRKVRQRSDTFADHVTQAAMFFRSLSAPERDHLVEACCFELGKVEVQAVRERVLGHFARIDADLAKRVADSLGLPVPKGQAAPKGLVSPALSLENLKGTSIATRKIAAIVADGVDGVALAAVRKAIEAEGAQLIVVAPRHGKVADAAGGEVKVDKTLLITASVEYDAVYVPGGTASAGALVGDPVARRFLEEAWRHKKPIGATGDGAKVLAAAKVSSDAPGVVVVVGEKFASAFVAAIAAHRHWGRGE